MQAIFSADAHVIEPATLWQERLPRALRDRALHYRYHGRLQDMVAIEGPVITCERFARPDGSFVDEDGSAERYLQDLEAEGIWGTVLYPNAGMHLYVPDHELAMAHARVYNDYVAETFGAHGDRLLPFATIPLTDVDDAVVEVERAANLGLRGILVPTRVPVPYLTDAYDRVWAAAQAHRLTVAIHTDTGFDVDEHGKPITGMPISLTKFVGDDRGRAGQRTSVFATQTMKPQKFIGELIGSGVMHRFPDLYFICAELQAFWLTSFMGAAEKAWTLGIGQPEHFETGFYDHEAGDFLPGEMVNPFEFNNAWPYPLRPSEYVRRQVRVSFMDDPIAVACREITGVECLIWGSDFPHPEATWPSSQAATEKLFAGVSAADKEAMMGGNLAAMYEIKLPVMA